MFERWKELLKQSGVLQTAKSLTQYEDEKFGVCDGCGETFRMFYLQEYYASEIDMSFFYCPDCEKELGDD